MNNDSDLQKAKNIETVEGTRRSYQKSFIYSKFGYVAFLVIRIIIV
jgi:hypothetical protein